MRAAPCLELADPMTLPGVICSAECPFELHATMALWPTRLFPARLRPLLLCPPQDNTTLAAAAGHPRQRAAAGRVQAAAAGSRRSRAGAGASCTRAGQKKPFSA